MKEYVETEKPSWLFVDAERGTELSYTLFSYFPAAHYKQAIDHALEQAVHEEQEDEQLVPDGGRYTHTYYAWYDPDTDTLLYHTEVNDEFANPFFQNEQEAHQFLERHVETRDKSEYEQLSLKKLKAKKVGEAVEVLTDQSGIEDFLG